jgi:transposase InsO family protein
MVSANEPITERNSFYEKYTTKSRKKTEGRRKKIAKKKERTILYANKHGKSEAARKYQESISNIKRWSKQYDGTWQSLLCQSRRPHSHPNQHTLSEEADIMEVWAKHGCKGMDYVYCVLVKEYGYSRTIWGLFHALRRLGLIHKPKGKGQRNYRQCTPCEIPGEKVQIDVKEVPSYCIHGKHKIDGKKLYQWTAIDECTRWRFVYGFEEHTPENSVKFFALLQQAFPFEIQCVQTDNGTEFTFKFISDEKKCPFEEELAKLGITHKLIKPRTPWHNGKVERSHRMDQRYFYEYEYFRSIEDFNAKLAVHLEWTNSKPMRIFNGKSPMDKLNEYLWVI